MDKVVVVGGGFAGMWAAIAAAREASKLGVKIELTLVSKDDFLTVRPRLYEANPSSLREPLKPVLDAIGATFVKAEISQIDPVDKSISGSGEVIHYDRLILASGSVMNDLAIPGADGCAFDLDSFAGAVKFDYHLRSLVQNAVTDETIIIVGSGFTGIEIATEMRSRLAAHGGDMLASRIRLVLIERGREIAPDLGANARPVIMAALDEAKVERRTSVCVERMENGAAILSDGSRIAARTLVLAVGLRASPLTTLLAVDKDEVGRLIVDDFLCVRDHPTIFAAGDAARARVDDSHFALMSCQHALTMGKFAGLNAVRDLAGIALAAYRQPDYVTCVDLGTSGALFTQGWDRKVAKTGDEAKALKSTINTEWIYPPTGGREALFQAAAVDALVTS